MRFHFLSFLFILTLNTALAQTQADWVHNNGAYTTDRGTAVAVDRESNVFVTGYFTDTLHLDGQTFYGDGFLDSYVAKMDSSGDFIWIRLIHGPKDDAVERITVLPNGNVVATGTFADSVQIETLETHAQGNDDVWLACLNGADGTPQWLISVGSQFSYERVGGLTSNEQNIFWGINFGSNVIVNNDTITALGFNDALVARLDFNGNIQSTETLTGSGNDNITAITCDANGNVYAGGRFNGTFYNDTAAFGFDLFYCKLANDSIEWMKTHGGWGSEAISALTCDNENVFVAGIFTDTLAIGDTTLLPDAVWSDQVFVTSVDANGNNNWFFTGFPDSGADYISDITVACNGDLLFTGLTTFFANAAPESPKQHNDNKTRCAFGDTYIARINHQGELLWIKNTLGTNLNSGLGIAADSSGHIYVTGYFTDSLYLANVSVKGNGGNDNFLFRINDAANACAIEDTTVITAIPSASFQTALLYPNPSKGNAFLLLNTEPGVTTVSLNGITGKTIGVANVSNKNSPLSMIDLFGKQAPGVYVVTLESNASRETLKWIVVE